VSDETPMAEPIPAAAPPAPAPHRCIGCGAFVPPDEILERERNGRPFRSHRRRALDFALCGPIVETLVFHVYAKVQSAGEPELTIRTFLVTVVVERWSFVGAGQSVKAEGAAPDAGGR
jgi:predicted nucleic acid-binding Zn ribbon protein